jgi:RHS repeat-associated protein
MTRLANRRVRLASLINPFQSTGREYDTETGLYFYRARYFDSKIGRLLSEDPIGFSGGTDFYTYVLNNPTDYADPSGLKTQVCCRSLRFITGFLSGLNHCYVKITPGRWTVAYVWFASRRRQRRAVSRRSKAHQRRQNGQRRDLLGCT